MFLRPGKLDDQVGPQPTVIRVGRLLFDKIAMFQHAGHLDHPPKLDFAPAPSGLRAPQRLDQVRRLGAEVLLRFRKRLDLLRQAAIGLDAGLFDFLQLGVHFAQRFLDRLHEFVDGRLPLFQIAAGRLLKLLQVGLGQFEKRGVAALEGLAGQGPEGVGELLFGVVEQSQLLLGLFLLGGQCLSQFGRRNAERLDLFLKSHERGVFFGEPAAEFLDRIRRGPQPFPRVRPFRPKPRPARGRRQPRPSPAAPATPPRRPGQGRAEASEEERYSP